MRFAREAAHPGLVRLPGPATQLLSNFPALAAYFTSLHYAELRRRKFLSILSITCLLAAQTFTTLYSFTTTLVLYPTNRDGAHPRAGLVLSGSTLYGTAKSAGSSSNGTVFAVNLDGSGFTNLHTFTAAFGANAS